MKALNVMTIAALATSLVACNNAAESEATTTDAQEVVEVAEATAIPVSAASGQIEWRGWKTNVDWGHVGTIQVKDGSFDVKDGALVGGNFTIDMNSIHATDIEEGTEDYNNLVGHLKSDDFFGVAEYPEATFEITDVMNNAEGETSHTIKGNLTMRGETKNVEFGADVQVGDGLVAFKAPEFTINRTNWNVMFRSSGIEGVTKDQLIDDYMELKIDLTAQN